MRSPARLDEIAKRHGTDKSSRHHGHTLIYEQFLEPLRDRPLTVLEIGVHDGASMRMWAEYFGSARIVGIDKHPESAAHAEGRVEIFVGSQADRVFLSEIAEAAGPFDVVVDDGAHLAKAQRVSLESLWPHVRAGGIYAIEDLHTSYLEAYGMGWRRPGSSIEDLKELVDDLNAEHHDHPPRLPDLESIHFFEKLCLMRRVSASK